MKTSLLLCFPFFAITSLNAQTKGPISGSGFSNEALAGSNQSWINVENASLSDNAAAYFNNLNTAPNSYTDYIFINKFGFDVPPGALVDGIEVNVERSDPDQNTAEYSVKIVKYGLVMGDEKSNGDPFPASDGIKTYGGPTDLWGEFWTDDMINDNGFGIAIAVQRINGSTGNTSGTIDDVTITIYYNDPTLLPVSLTNFSVKKNNGSIGINWTSEAESGLNYYEVQRSADGRNFSSLQSVQSRNSVSKVNYSVTDNKPLNGISYYRLKMFEVDGSATYSKIASVQFTTGNLITLYPTLWKKGTILTISNPNNEKLTAYFFNSSGQHIGSSTTLNSALPTSMLNTVKGVIYYKVINAEGKPLGTGNLVVN